MRKEIFCLILILLNITLINCIRKQEQLKDSVAYFNTIETGENARCLDGSYPGYYYQQGSVQNTLIYLIGMGNCAASTVEEILEICYERSFTPNGSNVDRPQTINPADYGGVFSTKNPVFNNWNIVVVPACDGGVYIGDTTVVYKDRSLYFRGQGLMKEIINDLIKNKSLKNQETVILSGGSAGALGTYQYSNYLKKILQQNNNENGLQKSSPVVKAIPDSGYFLDQPESFHETLKTFGAFLKNDNYHEIFPECVYQYIDPESFYKCIIPEYSWEYIQVPTFIVGSLYDIWQFGDVYHFKCRFNFNQCDQTTLDFMNYLKDVEDNQVRNIMNKRPTWGCWLVSCPFHGIIQSDYIYSNKVTVPDNSVYTISHTLTLWLLGIGDQIQTQRIDQVYWPNNTNCANIF